MDIGVNKEDLPTRNILSCWGWGAVEGRGGRGKNEGEQGRSRIWYTVIIFQTLCAQSIIYWILKPHNKSMRLNTIIYLPVRKIRFSRIKYFVPKYKTGNPWGQDSNQGCLLEMIYSRPCHPDSPIWDRNFNTFFSFFHPHSLNPCCLNTKSGQATKVQIKWGVKNLFLKSAKWETT